MRGRAAWAALAVFACAPVGPAGQGGPPPRDAMLDAASLRRRLYVIADDSMEGRLAGSIGNAKATAFIAEEFRKVGARPAGEGGGYFQVVPLVHRVLDSSSTFTASDTTVSVGPDFLPANLAFAGRIADRDVVFGGDLTDPARWLSGDDMRGRIVVLGVPDTQRVFIQAGWLADPRFALAAALAVVEAELLPPATWTAAARTPERHLADPRVASPSARRVPRFYLSRRAAERLFRRPLASLRPGDPLGRATLEVRAHELPVAPARNVIAAVPGSDPSLRTEIVVVGAHNDHLGFAPRAADHDSLRAFNTVMRPLGANDPARTPRPDEVSRIGHLLDSLRALRRPRADSIYNGAMDDGGGTITLLGIAEALMSARPRRTVLLVSHTAEEGGLMGSAWFMANPTVARERIVAMVNLDSYGGDGHAPGARTHAGDYLQLVGATRIAPALGALIDSLNAARSAPLALDTALDAPGHPLQKYCRSDHANYARYGIPVAFFSTGFNRDYHQVTDEAEYADFEYLARVGGFIRDLVLAIADRPGRLAPAVTPPVTEAACRQ